MGYRLRTAQLAVAQLAAMMRMIFDFCAVEVLKK
jgi:hypothetical protein